MALLIVEPPIAAVKAIQATVKDFAVRGKFRTLELKRARPNALSLTAPHAIYVLGLDNLVDYQQLAAAKLTGWRYLIQEGSKVIASAETATNADGTAHRFSAFNEGPFVRSTADALVAAENNPHLAQEFYEYRLLNIPALYVVALWLRTPSGQNDMLIPLRPTPTPLEAGRAYSAKEFFTALEPLVKHSHELAEEKRLP